jgi:hypothetical protein
MSDLLKKKARDRASEMARRGKKEGDESDEEEVEDLKVYDAPDQVCATVWYCYTIVYTTLAFHSTYTSALDCTTQS